MCSTCTRKVWMSQLSSLWFSLQYFAAFLLLLCIFFLCVKRGHFLPGKTESRHAEKYIFNHQIYSNITQIKDRFSSQILFLVLGGISGNRTFVPSALSSPWNSLHLAFPSSLIFLSGSPQSPISSLTLFLFHWQFFFFFNKTTLFCVLLYFRNRLSLNPD